MQKKVQLPGTVLAASLLICLSLSSTAFSEEPNPTTPTYSLSYSTLPASETHQNVNNSSPQAAAAAAGVISLTQSIDQTTITQFNSVACSSGGIHTDNSYYRRFDLDGAHGLSDPITIGSVNIGIEQAIGNGGSQPVEVKLYSIANASPLLLANLTPIGSASFSQADVLLTVVNFPVSGTVDPATDDLVVELFTPDGQAVSNSFFIGSNSLGQTAPSYFLAADCGYPEITDIATIGYPDMHIVMTVFTQGKNFSWPIFIPPTTGVGTK